MKTRMDRNSIEAFKELDLSKRQTQVFECIKETGDITAKGISFALGLPINHITGRITELMHKQLIKIDDCVKDVANASKRVNQYAVRKESDPLNVFDESWEEIAKKAHKRIKQLEAENKLMEDFIIAENLWIKFELLGKHEL